MKNMFILCFLTLMFAAFLCQEEAIIPSQTKLAESDEQVISYKYDIIKDLNIESSFQDIYSSQKVILNNKIFINTVNYFLDSSSGEKDNFWIFQFFGCLH